MRAVNGPVDVVDTHAEAAALALPPLVVRRPLEAWLDQQGLGRGVLTVTRIGAGHSNATFLLEREGTRMVLRRAPRPPLPPSAHDMLREALVLRALEGRARVPRVLAVGHDDEVLGVPFYVMEELRGHVVTDVPDGGDARARWIRRPRVAAVPAAVGSRTARQRA
jgi:aminoglycoside phosphotransferase (APT) family kinase protein